MTSTLDSSPNHKVWLNPSAAELQKFFVGEWRITRDITGLPSANGEALFTSGNDGLFYRENVTLPTSDGGELVGFREYHYAFSDNKISVHHASAESIREHFMEFLLDSSLKSSADHLCNADRYRGFISLLDPKHFTLRFEVSGPRKNYIITSHYAR